jgi:glycerophosphoryl diester phosphodiesterase
MRFIKILSVFILFSSCEKVYVDANTKIIGHAAMGLNSSSSIYANNSLEAIKLALSFSGCDGIELDLQLDNTGQLWLYHDEFLSSYTNANGCINDMESSALSEVFYQTIHHEKLVKFNLELIKLVAGKTIFLDLRHLNPCTLQYIDFQLIKQTLENLGIAEKDNFICITNRLELLNELSDDFTVFFATDVISYGLQILTDYSTCAGLVIRNVSITASDVAAIHLLGKEVVIFEVRSPKGTKTAFRKSPDYLMTDELRTALQIAN